MLTLLTSSDNSQELAVDLTKLSGLDYNTNMIKLYPRIHFIIDGQLFYWQFNNYNDSKIKAEFKYIIKLVNSLQNQIEELSNIH